MVQNIAKKIIITVILLFTLGSIYSTNATVGPSKCLKRTIQTELKRFKNPNWPEANQLSIYEHGGEFLARDYREQVQLAVLAGLELRASDLQVQFSNHSATPRYEIDLFCHLSLCINQDGHARLFKGLFTWR